MKKVRPRSWLAAWLQQRLAYKSKPRALETNYSQPRLQIWAVSRASISTMKYSGCQWLAGRCGTTFTATTALSGRSGGSSPIGHASFQTPCSVVPVEHLLAGSTLFIPTSRLLNIFFAQIFFHFISLQVFAEKSSSTVTHHVPPPTCATAAAIVLFNSRDMRKWVARRRWIIGRTDNDDGVTSAKGG